MESNLFKDEAECRAWCDETSANTLLSGPVHKHDDQLFVQLYLGGHEWVAINLDDLQDVRHDPGYEATVFGWAHLDPGGQKLHNLINLNRLLPTPEAEHPSITQDELLFGEKAQLESYLGMKLSELDIVRLPDKQRED